MANRTRIMAKRENEQGHRVRSQRAMMIIDQVEGAIKLESYGAQKEWSIILYANSIDSFKIAQTADISMLAAIYGGGLVGYIIARLMSRWVKTPVLEMGQSTGKAGQRWVQIRAAGAGRGGLHWQGGKATCALARDIAKFLQNWNYHGMIPTELDSEETWETPTPAFLVGGILVVAVMVVIGIIILTALTAAGS